MKNTLLLIGGLPGSGKSTLAQLLASIVRKGEQRPYDVCSIYETDDYFMVDGLYKFDPAKLGPAHAYNQRRVCEAMDRQVGLVIVANTFSQYWERETYELLARPRNYVVKHHDLYDAGLTNEQLAARCRHSVPLEKIAQMRQRWEK
jgi:tRNA uridine 5-carbamoylmethylation protein Kti12